MKTQRAQAGVVRVVGGGRVANRALAALLWLVLLGMLAPFIWMVVGALSPSGDARWFNVLTQTPRFDRFATLFTRMPFGSYTLASVIVAVAVTVGNLLLCLPVGYALARGRFRGRNTLVGATLAVLMLPAYVMIVPLFLLIHAIGWYDTYWALIVPFLVSPIGVLLVRQAVASMPPDLEEAAVLDGAGMLRVVYGIVMPLIKPMLAMLGVQIFWLTWNSFIFPFILADQRIRTLPVALAHFRGYQQVDLAHLFAAATVAVVPVIIVFLVFQRHVVRGLMAGALKE